MRILHLSVVITVSNLTSDGIRAAQRGCCARRRRMCGLACVLPYCCAQHSTTDGSTVL